jgi:hypothetical protein
VPAFREFKQLASIDPRIKNEASLPSHSETLLEHFSTALVPIYYQTTHFMGFANSANIMKSCKVRL